MSFIKKCTEYMRDNPKGYWFKRKLYGWGWVPVLWQGWAVIAAFLLYIVWVAMNTTFPVGDKSPTPEMYWYLGKISFGVIVLIAVCFWKGEKPRWQWGIRKE